MPNYCFYAMRVKGKRSDIKKMNDVIDADYDYRDTERVMDKHLFRTWNNGQYLLDTQGNYIEVEDIFIDPNDETQYIREYMGECAWSVSSCMLDTGYYNDFKNYDNFNGTTLEECSIDFNLEVECISGEPGMEFEEYYYFKPNGHSISECHSLEYNEAGEDEEWCYINRKADDFRRLK